MQRRDRPRSSGPGPLAGIGAAPRPIAQLRGAVLATDRRQPERSGTDAPPVDGSARVDHSRGSPGKAAVRWLVTRAAALDGLDG
jgi:hypothetical protein